MEALQKSDIYTYADYCLWPESERWELIDGIAYAMSPAPSWEHQAISSELLWQLRSLIKDKQCKVFTAPFDVRLNADTLDDTVVQPDLVIICDRSKLSGTGCIGAPDMVIEILSPSTAAHDRMLKFNLYLKYGVREYWIVDPDSKTVSAHILDNGRYYIASYGDSDEAPVHIFDGCTINLSDVFEI